MIILYEVLFILGSLILFFYQLAKFLVYARHLGNGLSSLCKKVIKC